MNRIPHDFVRFGPTELEAQLRELLHADDKWTYIEEKEGIEWPMLDDKTEEDNGIEKMANETDLKGTRSEFIRKRTKGGTGDMGDRCSRAMQELKDEGPIYTHQIDLVKKIARRTGEIRPKRGDGIITWGREIPLGDCEIQEVAIGNLHFRAIDYGDTIRLSEKSRILLGNVEAQEENQCVFLHTAAGLQWGREGRKNGVPTLVRVLEEAVGWRKEEHRSASAALAVVGETKGEYAREARSISHDEVKCGNGRDYRGFVLLLRELFARNNIPVRVFDLRSRDEGGYILAVNLFVHPDGLDAPTIDLLAYKHHMRRLKLCEDTLGGDRKSRKEDSQDHFREYHVVGWKEKMSACPGDVEERIVALNKCRFCKVCVGTATAPDRFYGEGTDKGAWNTLPWPMGEPYAC